LEAGLSHGEMLNVVNPIGAELTPRLEQLLLAIYRRNQERVWTHDAVLHMEHAIEAGLYQRPERPITFAFLDLTAYTRLTDERGDADAAGLASDLSQLVQTEARRHNGTVVKWLGDGTMLTFADAAAAVLTTIDVGRQTADVGLPPAHSGVAAGPVVFQDGDYFGRTVNLAARLAGLANPGQTLVEDEVVRLTGQHHRLECRNIGEVPVKGMIHHPVNIHEALPSS
jgi:adenylate cyclase